MSEYLAESYIPRAEASGCARSVEDLSKAAAQLAQEGTRVRLKRSIALPEEETYLYLFEAPSRDAVCEAAARSGLRFERVVEAVSGWPGPAKSPSARTEAEAGAGQRSDCSDEHQTEQEVRW